MIDPARHYDDDPRPRRSPRLFAEMGDVPGSVPPASLRPSPPTPAQRERLARDLAIYLAIEGGMSFRMVGRAFGLTGAGVFKAYGRMLSRKSRV